MKRKPGVAATAGALALALAARGGQQATATGGQAMNATASTHPLLNGRIAAGGPGDRRPHTAFVLSGGASLGALQVGMLRALYERDIVPDLLVGTSAGALNAAFVASRPQTVETAKQLARVWRRFHRQDVFRSTRRR
jgi:predicted acylesterase/phospholipase RssA